MQAGGHPCYRHGPDGERPRPPRGAGGIPDVAAQHPDTVPGEVLAGRRLAAASVLHPVALSARPLPPPRSPILVAVVRDEAGRLSDFLRHYRRLGIRRFAFLDNDSRDGTPERLGRQPDADVFRSAEPFGVRRKQAWINALVERYGRERWYLCVDADEHLVFDELEQGIGALTAWAEASGVRRFRARLVDMYDDGPVLARARPAGMTLGEACPFFDPAGYREWRNHQIVSCIGGPRLRVLSRLDPSFQPQLTKYPLFRPGRDDHLLDPHVTWPYGPNFAPLCHLALLHYKFDDEPVGRIAGAVARGAYWNGSAEYRLYARALREDPLLSFHHGGSRRYRGPEDLLAAGLIDPFPGDRPRSGLGAAMDDARRQRRAERLAPMLDAL